MTKTKGKKAEKKEEVKELSEMTLSSDDVLAQLKEALQVEDFQPEIELAPREGKVVYKIDTKKVDELRELIKTVQADKLEKNPAWQGIPLTTKKLCEIFEIDYEYDSKKKTTDAAGVVTTDKVRKEHASLPTPVEDAIQDVVDDSNGYITLDRIKGGGLKDKTSGKVMPAYWVKYVVSEGNPEEAELLDVESVEVKGTGTSGAEGKVEELNLD